MQKNIASIIHENAKLFSNKDAIVFLKKNASPEKLTFKELDKKAGAMAQSLKNYGLSNKKIILLYHTSTDYFVTYLACLYAGVIPITVAPFHPSQLSLTTRMLLAAIEDSGTDIVLTSQTIQDQLKEMKLLPSNISILNISRVSHKGFFLNDVSNPDDIICIQSTSGTSGHFKGVLISGRNLLSSIAITSQTWRLAYDDISLSRTPHFYIYGLIIGFLLPLYNGNTNYVIPPVDVLPDPLYWLKMLSHYQATYSGCPNFGYQECIDKNTDFLDINLSHWRIAIFGGDVIQPRMLHDFEMKFKPMQFRPESYCISYGMTEMTGFITATDVDKKPDILFLDRAHLRKNKINFQSDPENSYQVVSCGKFDHEHVKIIDSARTVYLKEREIGDICVSGPTLCQGYLASRHTFNKIPFFGKEYYCTGDIGFIFDNELYVLSRQKEIINIANTEYYSPIEIESIVKSSHDSLNNSTVVAFSDGDKISLLVEILSKDSARDLFQYIHQKLIKLIGLHCHQIVFVPSQTLPRTPSGKLMRNIAIERFFQENYQQSEPKVQFPD